MPIRVSTCPSMPSDISNSPKATGWIRFSGWWFLLPASHGGRTKSDKAPGRGGQHGDVAECRSAWIRIVLVGRQGSLYLLVAWKYFWGTALLEKSSLTACPLSSSASAACTDSQGSHRADCQQRGNRSHGLCCGHSSLMWDKVRTYIHWLLVLNILLISKNNWRSMWVASLGWSNCYHEICVPYWMHVRWQYSYQEEHWQTTHGA